MSTSSSRITRPSRSHSEHTSLLDLNLGKQSHLYKIKLAFKHNAFHNISKKPCSKLFQISTVHCFKKLDIPFEHMTVFFDINTAISPIYKNIYIASRVPVSAHETSKNNHGFCAWQLHQMIQKS